MNIVNASQGVLIAWALAASVAVICELLGRELSPKRKKQWRVGYCISPVGMYTAGAMFITALVIKGLFFR